MEREDFPVVVHNSARFSGDSGANGCPVPVNYPWTLGKRAFILLIRGSEPWLDRCGQAYRNRASGTSLNVAAVDFLHYAESENDAGPSVKLTRSLYGHNSEVSDKAFVSIVLRRSV